MMAHSGKKNPKDAATSKGHDAKRGNEKQSQRHYCKTGSSRKRISVWYQTGHGVFLARGQDARTLLALVRAGDRGITALEMSSWAYRLGAYVHRLRTLHGLDIETLHETHNDMGDWHARYVLHHVVILLSQGLEVSHGER